MIFIPLPISLITSYHFTVLFLSPRDESTYYIIFNLIMIYALIVSISFVQACNFALMAHSSNMSQNYSMTLGIIGFAVLGLI